MYHFIIYTTRIISKYSNSNESPWQYSQRRPRHQFAGITKDHVELHHEYVTSKTQSKETPQNKQFSFPYRNTILILPNSDKYAF